MEVHYLRMVGERVALVLRIVEPVIKMILASEFRFILEVMIWRKV